MKGDKKFTLTVYIILVFAAIFTESMAYINEGRNDVDFFSVTIGLVGYFGLFMHSQQIINKNEFGKFGLVGLVIFIASLIKQSLTSYHQLPLLTAGLPFFYILYFRIITSVFYRGYPKIRPTIIFATKMGVYYQADHKGYKPKMKESLFSLLLFFGFMGTAFGLILFIKELSK